MKKVRYVGEWPADLTTLGKHVEPNDVIDVADEFDHPLFADVQTKKGGEVKDATTK